MPCSTPCAPSRPCRPFSCNTSTSSSSITCTITPRLSKKPLTATRSIRFVVALYSVFNTVLSSVTSPFCDPEIATRLNERRTSGDSSSSTARVRSAVSARRWVGNGICTVLQMSVSLNEGLLVYYEHYKVHVKSASLIDWVIFSVAVRKMPDGCDDQGDGTAFREQYRLVIVLSRDNTLRCNTRLIRSMYISAQDA
nr:hypothetical protein CFP56_55948 [Quercus suber]